MWRIFIRNGSDIYSEEVLRHYADVLKASRKPMFHLARSISIAELCGTRVGDFKNHTTEELINIHSICLKSFMKLYRKEDWCGKESHGDYTFLDLKIEISRRLESPCVLCENLCKAERYKGVRGRCGVLEPKISSMFIHMGEEDELIPSYTVFFSGCNFSCIYCQNWDISQRPDTGVGIPESKLATMIDDEYDSARGKIRNVNWVGGDPIPNMRYILEVMKYIEAPLPQVWNSNFYLTSDALSLLFGVIDLYLPDFKYGNNQCATILSKISRYYDVILRNIKLASKYGDIIVRHLVLPDHLECCTYRVINALADMKADNVKVNIMDQYRPEYHWHQCSELGRRITAEEYKSALSYAIKKGIKLVEGQG